MRAPLALRVLLLLVFLLFLACGEKPRPVDPRTVSYDVKPFPAKPWPAEGMCVDHHDGCRKFKPAEIDAIRQAVLDELISELIARRPELARARELASWPISTPMIGGYQARTALHPPQAPGLVLELVGTARMQYDIDHGFRIVVTETAPGTWTVLSIDPTYQLRPVPG